MDPSYIEDTLNNISKIDITEEDFVGSHVVDFISLTDEPIKKN